MTQDQFARVSVEMPVCKKFGGYGNNSYFCTLKGTSQKHIDQ